MENEHYGDLTEQEYLDFLAEIELEDDCLSEAQIEADKQILVEEEQSLLELPENVEIEALYGEDAWRKMNGKTYAFGPEAQRLANERSIEANRQRMQRQKEDRIAIQRKAFNQNAIKMGDEIPKEQLQILLSDLVKEHTRMIDKYEDFINKRLTALLNPFIPRRLRLCKHLYPQSIRACPGFLYKVNKESGESLTFWAQPSIPHFFEQNTEQELLKKNKPEFLQSIDRAVCLYHEHLKKRESKELKYAGLIIRKKVKTYFDLLKLNPFWFDILFEHLTH